jgi:DNA polymerase
MNDIAPYIPNNPIKICLIGEAPGADEVKVKQPFVGKAGQLLTKALTEAGIDREKCYITNVFWTRPPNNEVGWFFSSKLFAKENDIELSHDYPALNGKYLKKIWEKELIRLSEELNTVNPEIIVTLGSTPLWALTGLDKITLKRGKTYIAEGCVKNCNHLKIFSTFHPSYILRNQSEYKTMVNDFKKILELVPDF